jgi:TPR repeat protein
LHLSSELAFRWDLRAAERGHVDAQVNMGVLYDHGEGVEVDYAAAAWLKKAAGRGDRVAQLKLGAHLVRWGRLKRLETRVESVWFQRFDMSAVMLWFQFPVAALQVGTGQGHPADVRMREERARR